MTGSLVSHRPNINNIDAYGVPTEPTVGLQVRSHDTT